MWPQRLKCWSTLAKPDDEGRKHTRQKNQGRHLVGASIKRNRSPYDPDEGIPLSPENWMSQLKKFADSIIRQSPTSECRQEEEWD
jgi:hypothetical protein